MSPKVGEVEGVEVSIKSAEHGNPHVHAWFQGNKVKIYIQTLGVEKGGLPPKKMKALREWIRHNETELLRLWEEIVNSR
jgi:hypothetical protein